jgi:hypothetical protein
LYFVHPPATLINPHFLDDKTRLVGGTFSTVHGGVKPINQSTSQPINQFCLILATYTN